MINWRYLLILKIIAQARGGVKARFGESACPPTKRHFISAFKTMFLAVLLCGTPTVGVSQGFWDSLFGRNSKQIKVTCEIRDRVCLLDTAIELAVLRYINREVKENWISTAREGQRLLSMAANPADRERYLDVYRTAEAIDDFYEELQKKPSEGNKDKLDTSWITPELVRQDFTDRHSSVKGDFPFYTEYALNVLMERDSEVAMSIWWEHLDMLKEVSVDAVSLGYHHILYNDVEGLKRFHENNQVPHNINYHAYKNLSYAAEYQCINGNIDDGKTILGILETKLELDLRHANLDKENYVLNYAPTVESVLHCYGKDAAMARLDKVVLLAERALAGIKTFYTKESERRILSEVIRFGVGDSSTVPFALWLRDQGHEDEAVKVLSKMPYTRIFSTFGGMAEHGTVSLQESKILLDRIVSNLWGNELHSNNPVVVLSWVTKQSTDVWGAVSIRNRSKYVFDAAAKIWPDPLARDAIKHMFSLITEIHDKGNLDLYELHDLEIRIAIFEREKSGCSVSDEKLRSWLDAINRYPSLVKETGLTSAYPGDYHQSAVLELYLHYITTAGNDTGGPCLIQ